jgi:hypothetical protein
MPLNVHYLLADGCSPGAVYNTMCVCANLPSPSHITLLAGSSVATPVQFSRLTASDYSGRLHIDVDNKPAEDYVKLTTSVCSGSTHLQLEPQLQERSSEVRGHILFMLCEMTCFMFCMHIMHFTAATLLLIL